jgi:flagellin-like protein
MKRSEIKKRGISPMIATVLLIAMVVVMAMVIFLWFRNMAKEEITKFGDENIELVCEDVLIEASYNSQTNSLTILNNGNVPVYGIKVSIYTESGNDEITLDKSSDSNLEGGINQGGIYTKSFSDSVIKEATKITLYPILLGNSNDGVRVFTCSNKEQEIKI